MKQHYTIGRLISQVGEAEAQRIAGRVNQPLVDAPETHAPENALVLLQSDLQHFSARFARDPRGAEIELREVTKIVTRAVIENHGFIERRSGDRTTAQFTHCCPISSDRLSDTVPWIRALKAGLDCVRLYHQLIEDRHGRQARLDAVLGTPTDNASSFRLAISGVEKTEAWKTVDLAQDIDAGAPPEMMTFSALSEHTRVSLHALVNRICECANYERIKSICRKADRSASHVRGKEDTRFTNLLASALSIHRRAFLLVDIHDLSEETLAGITTALPAAWKSPVVEGTHLELVPKLLPLPGLQRIPLGRTLPHNPNLMLAPQRRLAIAFWHPIGVSPMPK